MFSKEIFIRNRRKDRNRDCARRGAPLKDFLIKFTMRVIDLKALADSVSQKCQLRFQSRTPRGAERARRVERKAIYLRTMHRQGIILVWMINEDST